MQAFADCGIDPHFYANRERSRDEILPWSVIDCGVREDYLWNERQHAYEETTTPDCRSACGACGASQLIGRKCDG